MNSLNNKIRCLIRSANNFIKNGMNYIYIIFLDIFLSSISVAV